MFDIHPLISFNDLNLEPRNMLVRVFNNPEANKKSMKPMVPTAKRLESNILTAFVSGSCGTIFRRRKIEG
jgi:hypothetical protein